MKKEIKLSSKVDHWYDLSNLNRSVYCLTTQNINFFLNNGYKFKSYQSDIMYSDTKPGDKWLHCFPIEKEIILVKND